MRKDLHYAGFWVRLVADFVDSALLDGVTCLVAVAIFGAWFGLAKLPLMSSSVKLGGESFFDAFDPFLIQVVLVSARLLLSASYFILSTSWYGTTLGKRIFRIQVVRAETLDLMDLKQSAVRFCAYSLSYLSLGAGFLMCLFHPEKRGLHDWIADTVSVIPRIERRDVESGDHS